jgi:hypothetical protein
MSSKATSNSESTNSPKTGNEPQSSSERVSVDFVVDRGRLIGSTAAELIIGTFLLVKLGTIFQYIGGLLILLALWNLYQLTAALRHPPGTLVVAHDQVTLPRGLCKGAPHKLARSDIQAAYFLRRSVPWNKSTPVLVIESAGIAHTYPRDWFANEADQRRIISALVPASHG